MASSDTKVFQVGTQEVRVREEPNLRGKHVRWLKPGEFISVQVDSRQEVGNYVWWQHDAGWSAERTLNGLDVFMFEVDAATAAVQATAEAEKKKVIFQVGGDRVRVRATPSTRGRHLLWLQPGEQIEADADSRLEVGGYVWWQHNAGWSAERSLNDKELYLVEVKDAPQVELVTPVTVQESTTPAETTAEPVTYRKFEVGNQEVRVRDSAGVRGKTVRYLQIGEIVEVDASSRKNLSGYIWWQHKDGWSAEKSSDGSDVYLFEPGTVPVSATPRVASKTAPTVDTLPLLNQLFKRLPVDLDKTRWWQYFGNNVYAYNLWRDGKTWYKYCQGLHGGLDFGNSSESGVLVYAGVEGTYVKTDTRYYQPNGLWVQVDDYQVIYGHLINPRAFSPGQQITPDTVMGELQYRGQNHLHLEVRFQEKWIINPLLLMSEAMQFSLIDKFPPNDTYFYRDAGWNQWQLPLDQPILQNGGDLIGPHAR